VSRDGNGGGTISRSRAELTIRARIAGRAHNGNVNVRRIERKLAKITRKKVASNFSKKRMFFLNPSENCGSPHTPTDVLIFL
jgi:hypothetical protein